MSRRITESADWLEHSRDAHVAKRTGRVRAARKSATKVSQPLSHLRVVLLDGDVAQHDHLRSHLATHEPDWQLDLHTHGEPAWRALRESPPHVVLLERALPDGCGLEWLRRCKRQMPELPVVILTTQDCAKTLWAALISGAQGYCVKGDDGDGLVTQLRRVLTGKLALCDKAERLLPQAFALIRQSKSNEWGLTRREKEVMQCICRNLSDKEVAAALGISDETVHVHLRHAFKKLGVHDRQTGKREFSKKWLGGKRPRTTLMELPLF